MSHLFPSLGPALMISMGYIDLGKWVAAVEGGARFGFDLVFMVILFNCFAILCQYLSTCIGTATGKNLAEVLLLFVNFQSLLMSSFYSVLESWNSYCFLMEHLLLADCISNDLNFHE